ncbi:MAG: MFS transporter [Nocardiopsaceae bacterium]|nr:MFS transporter [Nocardiopsaceae bacterium]
MTTTSPGAVSSPNIRSLIPARIDRLPWSKFHTRLVMALGVAWILDGLEITIASNVGPDLQLHSTLGMSAAGVSDIAWWYLIGEVIGALVFGRLSDRLGRKNLFTITLAVYLVGSGLTAFTPGGGAWIFFLYITRVIAGMGIGGEYAAINSAIDELIPAKYRGRIDLAVNGTYWGGAILGTIVTLWALNHVPVFWGWRVGFFVGPVCALVIIYVRKSLPESPRWLIMNGRADEAEASIRAIEQGVEATHGSLPPVDPSKELEIQPTNRLGYLALVKVLFQRYPTRSILVALLMITQSFLYNAIFFTSSLVLSNFFHVSANNTPYYFFAFAAGNLLGPLTIGRLFDTVGRKTMISSTYIGSGVLLIISAVLFDQGVLNATTQTIAWAVIFFFASAGASAGYLTASEVFPLEVRAQAIAVFFAIAQFFGAFGPTWFGELIGSGKSRGPLLDGYLVGAVLMIVGGIAALIFGVKAEGKSLEDVATPLSVTGKPAATEAALCRAAAPGLGHAARARGSPFPRRERYRLIMTQRLAPRDLRASDSDRERVVAMLNVALGDGRLTQDEHSERINAALTARTLGDLARLTTDLASPAEQPVRLDGGRVVTGLFGTQARTGRWVAPPVLTCTAVCGEVVADFTTALLQARHTVVYAYAFCGRVRLIVPDGVEVVLDGTTLIGRYRGGTSAVLPPPEATDVPVIEVHAFCVAGEVLAKTPPRPRRWFPLRRR